MSMSREEIIDLAGAYIGDDEVVDFPLSGDLFALFDKDLSGTPEQIDARKLNFISYNVCLGYEIDEAEKPPGKWLVMSYLSLPSFPPFTGIFRLQPPHVAMGHFQNADRTREVRIMKVALPLNGPEHTEQSLDGKIATLPSPPANPARKEAPRPEGQRAQILRFPKR